MSCRINVIYAWIIFATIITVELLVDYSIRTTSVNFYNSGIPEELWFLPQILAAIIGVFYLVRGIKKLESTYQIISSIFLNIFFGIMFYIVVVYSYILGLGIDSI